MFFGKKKQKGPVSVEEIQSMQRKGMTDREIIKKMKKSGYSYDEIEKAMLQSVKQGVSGEPELQEIAAPANNSFSLDDLYQQQPQQPQFQQEQEMEINTENVNAEAIIEELIEGVIEEKWEKFNKKIKEQEQNLENIAATIKQ